MDEQLVDYALGQLAPAECGVVEARLARDPTTARKLESSKLRVDSASNDVTVSITRSMLGSVSVPIRGS